MNWRSCSNLQSRSVSLLEEKRLEREYILTVGVYMMMLDFSDSVTCWQATVEVTLCFAPTFTHLHHGTLFEGAVTYSRTISCQM
jgi:hypothetical protein